MRTQVERLAKAAELTERAAECKSFEDRDTYLVLAAHWGKAALQAALQDGFKGANPFSN